MLQLLQYVFQRLDLLLLYRVERRIACIKSEFQLQELSQLNLRLMVRALNEILVRDPVAQARMLHLLAKMRP